MNKGRFLELMGLWYDAIEELELLPLPEVGKRLAEITDYFMPYNEEEEEEERYEKESNLE